MNLDDIQVIWDSQNDRTMYQFDEQAVVSTVQRRGSAITSYVSCFEIAMFWIMLAMAVMLLMEPVVDRKEYYQIPHAVMSVAVAIYIGNRRRLRKKMESQYDDSLLGMLDRSIYQLGYQIELTRAFPWWFLLPMFLGALISFPFVYDSKPIWVWPMVGFGLLIAYVPVRRQIQNNLEPNKVELESLRTKLSQAKEH